MKRLAYLTGFAGLLVVIGLVIHQGAPAVLRAFYRAGWPLLLLLPAHLLPLLLDAQGWKILLAPIDPLRRASLPFLLWVASVREGVSRLLPVVGVGGEVVGIRLTCWRLSDMTGVTATVIVEVLLTLVTQYLFCALGIVLFLASAPRLGLSADSNRHLWAIALGLALSLPIPLGVYLLLRHGAVFARLENFAVKMLGGDHQWIKRLDGHQLDGDIKHLFAQPARLLHALFWQLSGYVLGSFETWFALLLLDHRVSWSAAVAIEALTQAIRHAAFMVPAGLGVQEVGVMLFGYLAGLDGDTALSLALIKRMREIVFSVPALLSWQWLEIRRLK
jgi:putative membrane protein